MRFRTGLLAAGLAVGVMMGVGGTTAASASVTDRAGATPTVAASWTGKPGCKFKVDRGDFRSFAKEIGVSEKRLKQALVGFEQKAMEPNGDIDSSAEVKGFARKLGVTSAKAGPILKKMFGKKEKPCKRAAPADLDEGKRFAQKLGVTVVEVEPVLDWATEPDGEFIEIDPKSPKCVEWAKKLRVSPKRLATELEDLKLHREVRR